MYYDIVKTETGQEVQDFTQALQFNGKALSPSNVNRRLPGCLERPAVKC
jgi:hypothetical protein